MTDPIREAFEQRWIGDDCPSDHRHTLRRNAFDEYADSPIHDLWVAYQWGRADLLAEQQAHPPAQPERGERALRQLLALWYSGPGLLYTDDGELQDNSKHPCIDFLRDSPETLAEKMRERAQPAITDARVAQLEAALRSLIAVTADGNTSRVVGMMLDNARALLERK